MKLAVGMPVFERAWILPLWFKCLEAQNLASKEDISLCFAYSPSLDGTYEQLRFYGEQYGDLLIYEFDLKTYDDRMDMARFHELTSLRNALLDMAIETNADYFLSWDNDILFWPDSLQSMFDVAGSDKAVGALMDMGGRDDYMGHPSVMHFPTVEGEIAYRKPWSEYSHDTPFQCDVIMAVKLMGKEVYQNTRYVWDPVGEDIGWCLDAESKGYARYLQPLAHGIHVYDKDTAVSIQKKYKDLDYPDILHHLRSWHHPNP